MISVINGTANYGASEKRLFMAMLYSWMELTTFAFTAPFSLLLHQVFTVLAEVDMLDRFGAWKNKAITHKVD